MSELAPIMNQILGLSTQIEQLQANQEKVASFLQSTSTQTQSVERVARSTNLTMEGIARKTDDSYGYLQSVEASIKKLQETQLDTSSLSEGVHQLISDSFIRLQRYMEQRYPSGQPLDLGQIRAEAKRDLAADLLRKLEQLFDYNDDNNATQQTSDFATLQQKAALLQEEVATIANRQEKALHLLGSLRHDTPLFRRVLFPVAEQDKRDRIIAGLAQHIKSSSQDQENLDLANKLAEYITEVNTMLSGLRELRNQLLGLWTEDKFTNHMVNEATLDLTSVILPAATNNIAKANDDSADDDLNDNYTAHDFDQFHVDDAELLFKSEQS